MKYVLKKPNVFLDFIQRYQVAQSFDLVGSEGFLYIPSLDKVIPTIIIGICFAKMFTLGFDLSSFWLSRENNLVKMRGLF